MAVISVAKLSELEGAKRLDAEYYQPEYSYLLANLYRTGALPVKMVAVPMKRKFRPLEGEYFDYIEIAEVDLSTGEFNTSKIIGEEAPNRAQWVVKRDDILISTVRPIRNAVVWVRDEKENLVCSSGFAVIHPTSVSSEYLFIYFKTKYIAKLLDRYTTATEYPAVTWKDILNIPVFLGNKELRSEITEDVNKAFTLLEQSQISYSQAENLLLEELRLKNFKPKYELSYVANLSQAFNAHRIDAEYFQPVYGEVVKKVIECPYGYTKLLNCVENVKPDFDPLKYPDITFSYIELADVDSSIGVINSKTEIKGEEAPSRARRILRKNEVIVSSVEGSLEKVALVDDEHEGSLASTGFFQFKTKNTFPEVLLVLSKSIAIQAQLKRECSGTILTAVPNKALKRIIIPLLPIETQQQITSLVQQSHEARRRAKELLEEAKRRVEEAIESEIKQPSY